MWVFSAEIAVSNCCGVWNFDVPHSFLENLCTPALINNDMYTVRRSMRDNMRKGLPLLSAFIYTEQHIEGNLRYRFTTTVYALPAVPPPPALE
jgi:hypothetical protein